MQFEENNRSLNKFGLLNSRAVVGFSVKSRFIMCEIFVICKCGSYVTLSVPLRRKTENFHDNCMCNREDKSKPLHIIINKVVRIISHDDRDSQAEYE